MKTQGEIEAAICDLISRVELEYMGRGPSDIRAHLIGDLLVVRLQGVLTATEQQLVKSLLAEKGRNLLKQVRTHLIETARPVMEAMIQEVTGVEVLSLHHVAPRVSSPSRSDWTTWRTSSGFSRIACPPIFARPAGYAEGEPGKKPYRGAADAHDP